jgi:hypothetical protein
MSLHGESQPDTWPFVGNKDHSDAFGQGLNLQKQFGLPFHRLVLQRAWTAFIICGLAFLLFAVGTVNLAYILKSNLDLVLTHGLQALMDGAAIQLVELLVSGYLSLACYVVFKTCEQRLVAGLGRKT